MFWKACQWFYISLGLLSILGAVVFYPLPISDSFVVLVFVYSLAAGVCAHCKETDELKERIRALEEKDN